MHSLSNRCPQSLANHWTGIRMRRFRSCSGQFLLAACRPTLVSSDALANGCDDVFPLLHPEHPSGATTA